MLDILPWISVGAVMIGALLISSRMRAARRPIVTDYDTTVRLVRQELAAKIKVDVTKPEMRATLANVVEHMIDSYNPTLDPAERKRALNEIVDAINPPR